MKMIKLVCDQCGVGVERSKSNYKRNAKHSYCSKACAFNALPNHNVDKVKCICGYCSEIFFRKPHVHRKLQSKSKSGNIYCSKSCGNKNRKHSDETKQKMSNSAKTSTACRDANEKRKVDRISKECPICKKKFKVIKCESFRIYCSRICCDADIKFKYKKKPKTGGPQKGSTKNYKCGYYKNIWCDSSWELAWVLYQFDHNIPFIRNKQGFEYIYKKQKFKYYPDFKLSDGTFIEIKGLVQDKRRLKAQMKYFPHPIKILYKNELKDIFKYVKTKYGTDYVSQYQGKSI